MKCSRCGTENAKGKNVCTKCGAFLYSSNPDNRVPLTKDQRTKRRKNIAIMSAKGCFWGVAIVIIAFIAIGILSFLFVRFIMPQDMIDDMMEPQVTEGFNGEEQDDFFEDPDD